MLVFATLSELPIRLTDSPNKGNNFRNFRLLLWKNLILHRRNWKATILDICIPLMVSCVLILLKQAFEDPTQRNENTIYHQYSLKKLPQTLSPTGRPWMLAYTPNNSSEIQIVMKDVSKHLEIAAIGFDSEEIFINENIKLLTKIKMEYVGLVAFNSLSNGKFQKDINIKLRLNPTSYYYNHSAPGEEQQAVLRRWYTSRQYPLFQTPEPRHRYQNWGGPPGYMAEGFLSIQHAVSSAVISYLSGQNDIPDVKMQRYPFPRGTNNTFMYAMKTFFPLIIMMCYIYTCVHITKNIVHEREKKLIESMKVMGLSNWLHWTAWFVKDFLLLFISTVMLVILIQYLLMESSFLVLLLFFTVTSIYMISFGFLVSVFFFKADMASTTTGLLFFCTYLPSVFVTRHYVTLGLKGKLLISLFGNTAISFGSHLIVKWEGAGSGVQFNNMSTPVSPDDSLTFLHIILMLLFDSILNFILTWYFEAVTPGEFGLSKPFYFPLLPSYWFGVNTSDFTHVEDLDDDAIKNQFIEANPVGLKAGISIINLSKVYKPDIKAVNDLTLNVYKNQITVVLGHNGAGKTTLMAMLTGIYTPTRGTAFVNNLDIRTNMTDIRRNLGFCPQHDILYDDLTVEEHLYFFCVVSSYILSKVLESFKVITDIIRSQLKGCAENLIKMEIDCMLRTLNFEDKRRALIKTLSGGMKRKLSIVVLDEPTSGMDPSARRSTWDLLNLYKKNRTILLTTHYMAEADILGDRIAIMSSGEIQCCGSSMFLKKKYGKGYHMVLVKVNTCNVDTIANLVTRYVPNAQMESNMAAEMSFILPHESSPNFQGLFQEIEDNKETLGISGFGASITTMEEVFIKAGESTTPHLVSSQNCPSNVETRSSKHSSMTVDYRIRNRGIRLLIQHIPKVVDSPSLTLNLSLFHETKVPATDLKSENTNVKRIFDIYKDQFASSYHDTFVKVDVATEDDFIKYLADVGNEDLSKYTLNWIIGAIFRQNDKEKMEICAFFNNQPYHAAPISLSLAQSALLNYYVGPDYRFTVTNHPLPRTNDIKAMQESFLDHDGFQVAENLSFGLAFLASSFIVYLVKERVVRAKHLQVISGVNLATFWITTFIWDFINYSIPCIIIIITFFIFNNEDFTEGIVLGPLISLLVMHAFGILPVIYCMSFLFTVPVNGQSKTSQLMIITGFSSMICVIILEMPQIGNPELSKILDWIFSLIPMYCLSRGTFTIIQNHTFMKLCDKIFSYAAEYFHVTDRKKVCEMAAMFNKSIPCCPGTCNGESTYCFKYSEDYFAWEPPGIGRYLVFLLINSAVFTLVLIGIERKFFQRLRFSDLTKNYGNLVAVNHLSLGITRGECFGLLGLNGAGKTTAFKMITGDEVLSEGNVYLDGFSIRNKISEVHKRLGYCPQFDAHIDEFTGSETLRLFARLRGMPESDIDSVIKKLSRDLSFENELHKLTRNYSGGNKRKLSTAVALIGDSPIVFLDEPTAGVDPVARRLMWKSICDIKDSGRSVLLTSHSMEECEALCERLVIMVNGELCCLGSPQHLKSKFSEGYTVLVKLKEDNEDFDENTSDTSPTPTLSILMNGICSANNNRVLEFKEFFMEMFPRADLESLHHLFIHYHIPLDPFIGWAKIFGVMEGAKDQYHIEDYTVSQTSLEQVFLQFAALQRAKDY
ncbi:ATP-binding cassette sub-family A member 17 [Nymphon striatum]|nr:ATP-binding cassette sub-family A member 17 [Nymphon striatum]